VTFPLPATLPTGTFSLPPISGRLFVFYRLTWWALAVIAVATLAWLWIGLASDVGISLLRTAKTLVLIFVSAILFRRRGSDPVAAMLALSLLLWSISSSVDFLASSILPALTDRFRFLFFAMALLLFPDGQWAPRWIRQIGAAIVATFVVGVAEASGLLSTSLFLPVAIGCILASLSALAVRYRQLEPGIQKQQLKWVLLGLVCGIALILSARGAALATAGMAIPSVGAIVLEAMFQLGIVVIALGFLTSLLRYRLYDAEAAISRSAVYAALTLTIVGTFAGSEALIELFGQRYFGMTIGNVSGAVAAAVAAMMLTPLHRSISGWAEQQFQSDLTALKAELPDLLAALSASASVRRLATAVLPRIEQAVHPTRMVLLADGKLVGAQGIAAKPARRLLRGWKAPEVLEPIGRREDDAFPLCLALRCPLGSVRGWLLLGPRPDGSFYGRDDLEALAEIAPHLQRTLLAVAEREMADRARSRLDREFRQSLDAIAKRVSGLENCVACQT
jgi:hypothetical protein